MADTKQTLYPQSVRGGGRESDAYKKAKKTMWAEIISGGTGLALTLFIMSHLTLESTILLGQDVYQKVVELMEGTLPMGKVLVVIITILFFLHFVYASRKIPPKLAERRRMKRLGIDLSDSKYKWKQKGSAIALRRHFETTLWIWQYRTGMMVLAMGAFHLFLVAWNIFTDMGFADHAGLAAVISRSRVASGLWVLYLALGLTVVVHMSFGVYRLAVKWVSDTWFNRKYAFVTARLMLVVFTLLNVAAVLGLMGQLNLR
jgi:fumarate reductase subunit C